MTTEAKKLARDLYNDDMSRADEVPVERDGHKAYDGWLRGSGEAGDRDTSEALAAVDRDEFAAAWEDLVDASDKGDYGTLRDYQSGNKLRAASRGEQFESRAAAERDGGRGVIEVDGRRCYVEE